MSNKKFAYTLGLLILLVVMLSLACVEYGYLLGEQQHMEVFNKDSYPQINYSSER